MDLNKAIIMGHVGMDPIFLTFENGEDMAKFSVATSRKWTDKISGEKKEATTWHNVVIFNKYLVKLTERFVIKGTKVYIEGELKTRNYMKDDVKRYVTEIIVPQVKGEMLIIAKGKGWTDSGPPAQLNQPSENVQTQGEYEDDIPF